MGVFVKICGCCSHEDVKAVAEMEPDAVGFIFWSGSKRHVSPGEVGRWVADLPARITKVGVFVNPDQDEVRTAMDEAGLDVAQLHGEESPEFCAAVGPKVWKAIHLNRAPPAPLDAYAVDAFLLDHHGGVQPGGTGVAVDWDAAARFVADSPRKVLLAGGLNPDNVAEAIGKVRPWGVDVSSGVEAEVGVKDLMKVKDFIVTCRGVE
jgi:phosphoribosylanthranilate isomerase